MKKHLQTATCIVLALALSPSLLTAQDDYSLFRERAGNASLLFRGHKAYSYEMSFNGTFYWSDPEFREGSVVYNGKTYDDVYLNIDAVRQDLLVRIPGLISNKVLEKQCVEQCTFGGRRYINLQYIYGKQAPSGYWEVLYDGKAKVIRRVTKTLEQDIDGRKSSVTNYDGPYRSNVYQTFTYSSVCCHLSEDGAITVIKRRRDLMRLIDKPLRGEVRRHVRNIYPGDMAMPVDMFCIEAVKYLESR